MHRYLQVYAYNQWWSSVLDWFFPLRIKGQDLILGMQWLLQLGPALCDWTAQTMSLSWAGQHQIIHGLQGSSISQAQTEEIIQDIKLGQTYFAISIPHRDDTVFEIPAKLQPLMEKFDSIPDQLPPSCDIEHHITLREGADPVKVRPYRYAHYQKEEIERQVHAMINTGIIQPSSSPFSSMVLLVKKKDGSWRFCTDYRALIAVMIKYRFPIPTVDDMLVEQHGATVFTKLDLTASYHQVRVHPDDVHKTAFRTHNGTTTNTWLFHLVFPMLPIRFRHWWTRYFETTFVNLFLFSSMTFWSTVARGRTILNTSDWSSQYYKNKSCSSRRKSVCLVSQMLTTLDMWSQEKELESMVPRSQQC